MSDMDPTDEEARWIAAFHRLAKRAPKSIWLYAGGSSLHVMRARNECGHHAMRPSGGVDPDYRLATIAINSSGGDW